MSLRRSARVSSQSVPVTTQVVTVSTKITSKRSIEESVKDKARKKLKNGSDELDPTSRSTFRKPEAPATPLKKASKAKKDTAPVTPKLVLSKELHPVQTVTDGGKSIWTADRPVRPHASNATLVTPGGTQTTAQPSTPSASPSRNGMSPPIATTGNLLDKAYAHLISVDVRLKPLIEAHPCTVFTPESFAEKVEPFARLCSTIMGQQVTGAAARSIRNKFIALFNEDTEGEPKFPTASQVAVTDIAQLRTAGLSQRKAEYIQGLAEKFARGELTNEMLLGGSDEEIMEKLIAVRGLGKWSVEMFSCFDLKRTDVFSTGDLGIQAGMARFHGKDIKKLKAKGGGKWKYMSEQDMLEKSAPFAPYRSLFMWYMWKVADVNIDVMEST